MRSAWRRGAASVCVVVAASVAALLLSGPSWAAMTGAHGGVTSGTRARARVSHTISIYGCIPAVAGGPSPSCPAPPPVLYHPLLHRTVTITRTGRITIRARIATASETGAGPALVALTAALDGRQLRSTTHRIATTVGHHFTYHASVISVRPGRHTITVGIRAYTARSFGSFGPTITLPTAALTVDVTR